jgi:hypothetical protein
VGSSAETRQEIEELIGQLIRLERLRQRLLRLAGCVRVIAALAFEVSLDLVGRNGSVLVHRAHVILGARTRKLATEKFVPEVRTMHHLARFGRLTAKGNLQATTSAGLCTIFP